MSRALSGGGKYLFNGGIALRIIALVLCFSFFGVNIGKEPIKEREVPEYVPYQIYVKNEKKSAPLEKNKCMSGVYIGEENIYSNIKEFENFSSISNDIYISTISPGENFPVGEIIDCYAKGKLPMLIVDGSFGSSQMASVARMCGNLDIEMIVEIKSDNKYIYECFAEMFRNYSPKTILAYGIDSGTLKYEFPDSKLVDWVAVDAKERMNDGNLVSEYENISKWCNYFKDKTVMVNISVPNFSIEKCNYIYEEAADEIARLYSLALEYNNIGALNYISCIEKYDNVVSCNYRITENELLINSYKAGVSSLVSDRYWSQTPYVAYVSGNDVIVSANVLEHLKVKGKFINSGYYKISPGGFNKSERKVFVNS